MGDKIIILKESKDGIVKDTIYETQDTISIDVSGVQSIELPSTPIDVNTPGKDGFDYTIEVVTLLGVLIAAVYTLMSIRKLFKKDEDKQAQIDELARQTAQLITSNKLYEKRIRMIHKPRIWSNGGNTFAAKNEWGISLDNKGEEAIITNVEIVGGDVEYASFKPMGRPFNLEKGGHSRYAGRVKDINPNDMELEIKVSYEDLEGYKYESYFKWKGGATSHIKTIEL